MTTAEAMNLTDADIQEIFDNIHFASKPVTAQTKVVEVKKPAVKQGTVPGTSVTWEEMRVYIKVSKALNYKQELDTRAFSFDCKPSELNGEQLTIALSKTTTRLRTVVEATAKTLNMSAADLMLNAGFTRKVK